MNTDDTDNCYSSKYGFHVGDVIAYQRESMPTESEATVTAVHPQGLEINDWFHRFLPYETSYIARKCNGHRLVSQPELPLNWEPNYCKRCGRQPSTPRSAYCRECQAIRKSDARKRNKQERITNKKTSDSHKNPQKPTKKREDHHYVKRNV